MKLHPYYNKIRNSAKVSSDATNPASWIAIYCGIIERLCYVKNIKYFDYTFSDYFPSCSFLCDVAHILTGLISTIDQSLYYAGQIDAIGSSTRFFHNSNEIPTMPVRKYYLDELNEDDKQDTYKFLFWFLKSHSYYQRYWTRYRPVWWWYRYRNLGWGFQFFSKQHLNRALELFKKILSDFIYLEEKNYPDTWESGNVNIEHSAYLVEEFPVTKSNTELSPRSEWYGSWNGKVFQLKAETTLSVDCSSLENSLSSIRANMAQWHQNENYKYWKSVDAGIYPNELKNRAKKGNSTGAVLPVHVSSSLSSIGHLSLSKKQCSIELQNTALKRLCGNITLDENEDLKLRAEKMKYENYTSKYTSEFWKLYWGHIDSWYDSMVSYRNNKRWGDEENSQKNLDNANWHMDYANKLFEKREERRRHPITPKSLDDLLSDYYKQIANAEKTIEMIKKGNNPDDIKQRAIDRKLEEIEGLKKRIQYTIDTYDDYVKEMNEREERAKKGEEINSYKSYLQQLDELGYNGYIKLKYFEEASKRLQSKGRNIVSEQTYRNVLKAIHDGSLDVNAENPDFKKYCVPTDIVLDRFVTFEHQSFEDFDVENSNYRLYVFADYEYDEWDYDTDTWNTVHETNKGYYHPSDVDGDVVYEFNPTLKNNAPKGTITYFWSYYATIKHDEFILTSEMLSAKISQLIQERIDQGYPSDERKIDWEATYQYWGTPEYKRDLIGYKEEFDYNTGKWKKKPVYGEPYVDDEAIEKKKSTYKYYPEPRGCSLSEISYLKDKLKLIEEDDVILWGSTDDTDSGIWWNVVGGNQTFTVNFKTDNTPSTDSYIGLASYDVWNSYGNKCYCSDPDHESHLINSTISEQQFASNWCSNFIRLNTWNYNNVSYTPIPDYNNKTSVSIGSGIIDYRPTFSFQFFSKSN